MYDDERGLRVLPIDEAVRDLANRRLGKIEERVSADFISFFGPITRGIAAHIRDLIKGLIHERRHNPPRLFFMLTTPGGDAIEVSRIVNVLRNFYDDVSFVVPDYAYSAGTILCMSGDKIYMDYFSVLGPIDPQITRPDGSLIPAQGYLDKANEFIAKSLEGKLSDAEMIMLNKMDLADLRLYEQARALTVDFLKNWLVKYKFRTWTEHRTDPEKKGQLVTHEERIARAEWVAKQLSDNNIWKAHGRGLDIHTLRDELRLDIEDYTDDEALSSLFGEYYNLIRDYLRRNKLSHFFHTRRFI